MHRFQVSAMTSRFRQHMSVDGRLIDKTCAPDYGFIVFSCQVCHSLALIIFMHFKLINYCDDQYFCIYLYTFCIFFTGGFHTNVEELLLHYEIYYPL